MAQSAIGVPTVELGIQIRPLLRRVYLWMTAGVFLTAIVSLLTVNVPAISGLLGNPFVVWGALIGELVVVVVLSAAIKKLSPFTAGVLFFAYAGLMGFSLSGIFFYYDLGSIALTFVSTTVLFGTMTIVGFITRVDLTKLGTYLLIGVFGLLVTMVLNLFFQSTALAFWVNIAGVVIFTALTAFDTQKIAQMAQDPALQREGDALARLGILGALTLYLDFINLFLFLLSLLGRKD